MSGASKRLRTLFVESFLGGSHEAFARGWLDRSRHDWRLVSLPATHWKWRQRLSAWTLGTRIARIDEKSIDAVVVTGLIDVAHLRLASKLPPDVPILLYLHENQLSYPRPKGEPLERSFAISHVASVIASESIAFNSRSHRDAMRREMVRFLKSVPAPVPSGVLGKIRRARVLHPGVDLANFPESATRPIGSPPTIVWNHRWEEDKRPSAFARIMIQLAEKDVPFRLILLGTGEQVKPKPLLLLKERLGDRIVRAGPAKSRREYIRWLTRGDIAVSTAAQENFGYSAVEAMAAGAVPLLPRRLSYPELIPASLAAELLYEDDASMMTRLETWIAEPDRVARLRPRVMRAARRHEWSERIDRFDSWLDTFADRRRRA